MGAFTDRLLLKLRSSAAMRELISPAADVAFDRVRTLLASIYEMPFATIHAVRDLEIKDAEFERPLAVPRRANGTWTQTTPAYARTDVAYESADELAPLWLDVVATASMNLLLEIDAGEVDTILTREITNITSLADFKSRFRFIDLDAFMQKHGLTTVADLREAYAYLLTEIKLKAPPPFDPNKPDNLYPFKIDVAILIREALDVAEALRDAKLARRATQLAYEWRREAPGAEARTPFGSIVVFPDAVLGPAPMTEANLRAFFAGEGIVSAFVPAP